jgi:SAM-dependent methyltransferase
MQLNLTGIIRLKLKELIETCAIPPDELAALLEDRYDWTEGKGNIEPARLRQLCETDCTGKTVLDIGGYDGVAAKRLLDQGASRAICLDNRQYDHYAANDPGHWLDVRQEGVEYVTGDFMQFRPLGDDCIGQTLPNGDAGWGLPRPDIVVFWNILYHLKNPWAALDKVREIVKPDGEMLLCTLFRYHKGSWIYLYEPRECNPGDDTVYFGPSLEALERLLKATGWDFVQEGLAYDRCVYRCTPTPGFVRTHEDT